MSQFVLAPLFALDTATLERLRSKGEYKEVLRSVDASLAKDSPSMGLVNYRLMALTALQRWQDTVDTVQKYGYLCKTNSEKAYFRSLAGKAHMKLWDFASAEQDFEEQFKLNQEKNTAILLLLGEAQMRLLKKDKAAKTLLSIDSKKMKNTDLEVRAKFLAILGRNEEALADIERCLSMAKNSYFYKNIKAVILIRMNRRREALALLRDVQRNATDKTVRNFAQNHLNAIADTNGPNIHYIVRLDDIDTASLYTQQLARTAEYAHQDGREQEALHYFNQIVKIQPFSANAIMRRARAQLENGRKKEGLADTNLAIEREPDNAEPYQIRARFFLDEKKVNQGVNDWLTVLRLAPTSDNYLEVSRVFEQLKKPEQSVKYAEQGIALAPDKIKLHLAKALALLSMKNPTAAISEFDIIEKNPEIHVEMMVQRDTWVARARAYRMLGKNKLAEAEERKVNTAQNDLFENAPFRNGDDTAAGARGKKLQTEKK